MQNVMQALYLTRNARGLPASARRYNHIVPYMKTVCESYASADLVRQLPVLLGGMAVYALEVWLAYRSSAARFEKVDL